MELLPHHLDPKMSANNFLRTLKNVERIYAPKPYQNLVNLISRNPLSSPPKLLDSTSTSLLSKLSPTTLRLILSDPNLTSSTCLHFFSFLLKNQSSISFRPDLHAHMTLICKLLKGRNFTEAENLFRSASLGETHPFPGFASAIEVCCYDPRIKAKLLNLMLKVYSDMGNFNEISQTFEYMRINGIKIDERTCTVHLLALKRADKIQLSLDFLYGMVKAGLEVSVYSLTVVVEGLCYNGEIKRSRELVEDLVGRGTRLNYHYI